MVPLVCDVVSDVARLVYGQESFSSPAIPTKATAYACACVSACVRACMFACVCVHGSTEDCSQGVDKLQSAYCWFKTWQLSGRGFAWGNLRPAPQLDPCNRGGLTSECASKERGWIHWSCQLVGRATVKIAPACTRVGALIEVYITSHGNWQGSGSTADLDRVVGAKDGDGITNGFVLHHCVTHGPGCTAGPKRKELYMTETIDSVSMGTARVLPGTIERERGKEVYTETQAGR